MSRVTRAVEAVSHSLMLLATAAAVLLCAFVFLSSVMRYFVGAPFRFSDELVGLLFLTSSFLAMPKVLQANQHIRITLLVDRYPVALQRAVAVAAHLALLAFCGVFAWLSWQFAEFSYRLDSHSDVGRIWLFPWMLIMPASAALLFLIGLVNLVRILLGDRSAWSSSRDPGAA